MFPHDFLLLQATWRQGKRRMRSEQLRSRGPESTWSSNPPRTQKADLSDDDRRAHRSPRGVWRIARSSSTEDRTIAIWRPPLKLRGTLWHVRFSSGSDLHRTALRIRGGTPRSRFDRAAIAARSSRDRGAYVAKSSLVDRTAIDEWPGPRSWPDRGPIVAKFVAILKENWSQFVAKSWSIQELRRRPKEPLPIPLQTASTIASIAHDFDPISLFKSMYFPSLFFNFWSIREGIK